MRACYGFRMAVEGAIGLIYEVIRPLPVLLVNRSGQDRGYD